LEKDNIVNTNVPSSSYKIAVTKTSFTMLDGPKSSSTFTIKQIETRDMEFNDDGTPTGIVNGTVVGDANPKVDDCSGKGLRMQMTGKNIGDVLNAKGITWGWF
jgi:phospholipase C